MRRNNQEKSTLKNNYQYNGIEHVPEFGLDWSMATYRNLISDIGIWGGVDPKAEYLYGYSPYAAMNNNPILYNDPEGDIAPLLLAGLIGRAIGGVGNTIAHWDDIQRDGIWAGVKAFGTGAAGGAVAAVTGTAAAGATLLGGTVIGAGAGISGDLITQGGNMAFFAAPTSKLTGPTAEVFDEFIDPYAVHSVSGGGSTAGSINSGVSFTEEFVVSAGRTYNLESAYSSLVNQTRQMFGGNVTVMRNGRDLFRVHQPTSGHGFDVTEFQPFIRQDGASFINRVNVPVNQTHLTQLQKALDGVDGYLLRTRGGR
jgi:RHS repeat-associated protein